MQGTIGRLDVLFELLLEGQLGEKGAEKIYNEATKEFRPLLNSVPAFAPVVAKDLALVSSSLLKLVNEVKDDESVNKELERFRETKAKARAASIKAYRDAGFTKAEAFQLLLVDIANQKATIASISDKINEIERKTKDTKVTKDTTSSSK